MLKGDLSSAPLAQVLRSLADGGATGCLHLADPAGESARAWLRDGRVYAVLAPGSRPALGVRLVSSGALGPEALAEAQEAQRTELQGWRLGELLVHLGYVDQPVVEAYVNEQVRDSLAELLPWGSGTWRFRVNERTREDVAAPVAVDDLLAEVSERRVTWASLLDLVHGPDAVPVLSAAGTSDAELSIDADAWSLLCQVDGTRTVVELARECGFTLYEAGRVVHGLVMAGLLDVEEPAPVEQDAPGRDQREAAEQLLPVSEPVSEPVPAPVGEEAAGMPLAPAAVAARLVSVLSGLGSVAADGTSPDVEPSAEVRGLTQAVEDEDVTGSISRVSGELDALLGPATAGDDLFSAPLHRQTAPAQAGPVDAAAAERARRDAVRREHDAEELADAQAALEAVRAADEQRREAEAEAARAAEQATQAAQAEQVRLAEEQAAAQAEQARLAEEQAAAQAEHARLADQAAAAALAAQAEQARLADEAEAARLRAEADAARAAEAERVRLVAEAQAQQAALEDQRREEQARVDEQARVEQDRLEQDRAASLARSLAQAEKVRVAQEAAAELAAMAEAEPHAPAPEPAPADARAEAEAQAAAFAELSASASLEAPVPVAVAAAAAGAFSFDDSYDEPPVVYGHHDGADTAALLRELSSLGLDDDASAPAARTPVTRPVSPSAQRKRKGLFGRG